MREFFLKQSDHIHLTLQTKHN